MPTTTDVWRLWPTVHHSLVACRLLWIPLWSAIQGDGQPQRRAADRDGVAFKRARRRKETTCPELVQPGSRARLVVLALDPHQVGAASDEAAHGTAVASSLVLDPLLCSCTGLCSFPVGARGGHVVDGHTPPDHEVERDHAGLCG